MVSALRKQSSVLLTLYTCIFIIIFFQFRWLGCSISLQETETVSLHLDDSQPVQGWGTVVSKASVHLLVRGKCHGIREDGKTERWSYLHFPGNSEEGEGRPVPLAKTLRHFHRSLPHPPSVCWGKEPDTDHRGPSLRHRRGRQSRDGGILTLFLLGLLCGYLRA